MLVNRARSTTQCAPIVYLPVSAPELQERMAIPVGAPWPEMKVAPPASTALLRSTTTLEVPACAQAARPAQTTAETCAERAIGGPSKGFASLTAVPPSRTLPTLNNSSRALRIGLLDNHLILGFFKR